MRHARTGRQGALLGLVLAGRMYGISRTVDAGRERKYPMFWPGELGGNAWRGAAREGEDSVGGSISRRRCRLTGRAHGRAASSTRRCPPLRRRGWLMRRLLLLADLVGLLSAFLLALALVSPNPAVADVVNTRWEVALFIASLPLWVLLARMHGLYDRDEERTDHSTVDDIFGVLQVVSIGTWGFLALTEIIGLPHPDLTRLVVFWAIAIVLVPLLRAVARVLGRRNAAYIQNVIIVGSGQVARLLATKIGNHPEYGLKSSVSSIATAGLRRNGNQPLDLLGTTADLPEPGAGALGAPGRDRLLDRLARADARSDPLDAGQRRPDRHRSAHVRGARDERAAAHDRGHSPGRSPDPAALRLRAIPQALLRHARRRGRARSPLAALLVVVALADQARLAWACALPAGAHGRARTHVPRLQVPDDGRTMPSRKRPTSRT